MSVSGISSTTFLQGTGPLMQPSRRQSEELIGRQLEQDLQNGDLKGAQQAYYQLAAFGPNNSGPFTDSKMAAEFQKVGQDLQSGNLAAAQSDNKTLSTDLLRQDVQAVVRASKDGNTQDPQAMKAAIANLKGDYWAVYGQQPTEAQVQGLEAGATPINIQA